MKKEAGGAVVAGGVGEDGVGKGVDVEAGGEEKGKLDDG